MSLKPEPEVAGFLDDVWGATKTAADAVINKDSRAKELAQAKATNAAAKKKKENPAASGSSMGILLLLGAFLLMKGKR